MKRKIDRPLPRSGHIARRTLKVHGDFRKLTAAKGGGANDGARQAQDEEQRPERVSDGFQAIPSLRSRPGRRDPSRVPICNSRVRADVRLRPGRARRFERARRRIDCLSGPNGSNARLSRDGATYLRWAGLFEFLISADGADDRISPPRRRDRRIAHDLPARTSAVVLAVVARVRAAARDGGRHRR